MENANNSVSLRKNQKDRKNIKLIILKRSNLKKKDQYVLTRIKTKNKNIRMGLFLRRTPSLEYNIIHITLLSENK